VIKRTERARLLRSTAVFRLRNVDADLQVGNRH
jgi:hypothetical protein